MTADALKPSFLELYTPKLVTTLKEGYGLADLRIDALAGLTVAIVALPLSMAIAIASGVTPDRGLYSAIIGGGLVSALGGSRHQIGGPAGAFIVLVAATVAKFGVDGLLLATLLSGILMAAAGWLRLGTFVKYIPHPVTVAFTAGIALIIFASQLKALLGVRLPGREPGALVPKLVAIWHALPTVSPAAVGVSLVTIGVVLGIRRVRPHWPAFILAVAVLSIAAWLLHLPIETIGTRFGGIPRALPTPRVPPHSLATIVMVMPAALSFALLGSIESLLSAVVADAMTGRRHRSNCELVAQGAANIGAALFGGFCVTGTIARTATNVRCGARGPMSGIFHALFILLFMVVAAPLASYIPLAALAAVLAVVTWTMADKQEFWTLVRASKGDAVVVLVTFLLVAFYDLTDGILAGFMIGSLIFLHRMAGAMEVTTGAPLMTADAADDRSWRYDATDAADPDTVVVRISGAFFFGAASEVATALDGIAARPKRTILDVSAVSMLDSTAADTIKGFVQKVERVGVAVTIVGASPAIRRALTRQGVAPTQVVFADTIGAAKQTFKAAIETPMIPAASL